MDSDESRILFFRRLRRSLAAGFGASVLAVILYLTVFSVQARGPIEATILSFAGVSAAIFTGPWSLFQILMGVKGSYYAFWAVTLSIVYVGIVFLQFKYLPRMIFALVAGVDLLVLIFGLWMARLIVI